MPVAHLGGRGLAITVAAMGRMPATESGKENLSAESLTLHTCILVLEFC